MTLATSFDDASMQTWKGVQMMRELFEREFSAAKNAVHAVREWIPHRTKIMKRPEFDRPLDDLGQSIEDVERRAEPPEPPQPRSA